MSSFTDLERDVVAELARPSASPTPARRRRIGVLAYGALFVVVLPLALVLWAARLDELVGLPSYEWPLAGALVAGLGATIMLASMIALRVHGRGLPMSAFPPERYVTRWTYRYLRNPIYVGAVILSLGLSLGLGSAGGLWIVTPALALAATAWVLGFERDLTRSHFGGVLPRPRLSLPPESSDPTTAWDRVSAYALVFLPWLVLFEAVEMLGVPPATLDGWMAWDRALPVLAWTEPVYFLAYPVLLAVPFVAATRADLRWFMIRGWLAIALIIPMYLIVPVIAESKPVVGDGILAAMMLWERTGDEPVTAFPSFHATWMFLAAVVYARRRPRLSALWWMLAAAVSVSCITTGMHAAIDIVAAVVVTIVIVRAETIRDWLRRRTETLANSWSEAMIGPVRLINHGIYAALGGALGTLVAVTLAGPGSLGPIVAIAAASIVGAALWAQLIEGSPQLLRPYGYFGSVAGATIALLACGALGLDAWTLAAAFSIGCSITQALGRGRCLVQGCCHGAECAEAIGIRYHHPRSRVIRLSTLGGRPLHPTQLYSALWMLTVAAILLRLWTVGAGVEMIVGIYFLLGGLGRIVEEHLRGEPQTPAWGGLRLYQWFAIGFVVAGAAISSIGATPAPPISAPAGDALIAVTVFGVLVYIAYGVDFPRLGARFSRLV
ncbi:MAG TPA: prolipoprotein diacylglyceryl transferase family protein [Candidatus Kapabacteria bacterium]|nr:prolipoprotein diacylglyceryl transferase family protein [Candidatus Kapabacteria bacterium]